MTKEELEKEINFLKFEALAIIFDQSPKRTMAMARSFKINETANGFEIYTDISYMKYVEDNELLRGGRANYNRGWFDRTINMIIEYMESRLNIRFIRR